MPWRMVKDTVVVCEKLRLFLLWSSGWPWPLIFLLSASKCWDYEYTPPYPTSSYHVKWRYKSKHYTGYDNMIYKCLVCRVLATWGSKGNITMNSRSSSVTQPDQGQLLLHRILRPKNKRVLDRCSVVRAHVTSSEDVGWIPTTHTVHNSSSGDVTPFSDLWRHVHDTHTRM